MTATAHRRSISFAAIMVFFVVVVVNVTRATPPFVNNFGCAVYPKIVPVDVSNRYTTYFVQLQRCQVWHTHTQRYTRTHTQTHTSTNTHEHSHTHLKPHTDTHTHIQAHTDTNSHTQTATQIYTRESFGNYATVHRFLRITDDYS